MGKIKGWTKIGKGIWRTRNNSSNLYNYVFVDIDKNVRISENLDIDTKVSKNEIMKNSYIYSKHTTYSNAEKSAIDFMKYVENTQFHNFSKYI